MNEKESRFKEIKKILIFILVLNWGVALAKIIYGFMTHFTSMTADGFHSLSDGASNIIGLVGINLASRPADKDHPYGHKKYETLFSLVISALLFIVCFNLMVKGISRLHNPGSAQIDIISFVVMVVTMLVNLFVMKYENQKGKMLKSDILVSDSLHTKADIFTSASVIVALVITKMGYPILDPIVTIVISFFIASAAFEILKNSSNVLCDTVAVLDERIISNIVMTIKGVKACHKIRTRGREDDIHVDLHVQVSPDMRMEDSHEISYKIEDSIKREIPGVADVVVHMEPHEK